MMLHKNHGSTAELFLSVRNRMESLWAAPSPTAEAIIVRGQTTFSSVFACTFTPSR